MSADAIGDAHIADAVRMLAMGGRFSAMTVRGLLDEIHVQYARATAAEVKLAAIREWADNADRRDVPDFGALDEILDGAS